MTLKAILEKAEKDALIYALVTNGKRIGLAATSLGIHRKTMWEKMKKHSIFSEFLVVEEVKP